MKVRQDHSQPLDWEPMPVAPDSEPQFRHTGGCEGTVSTWRSRSDLARDRAYCDKCGQQWSRPDARFRWREAK